MPRWIDQALSKSEPVLRCKPIFPTVFLVQQQNSPNGPKRAWLACGSPVTIRIVKGANMEMERVEASLRVCPQASYTNKQDTDANYKRMLIYGMHSDHISRGRNSASPAITCSKVAFALVLPCVAKCLGRCSSRMLEGIANHQASRAARDCAKTCVCTHQLVANKILLSPLVTWCVAWTKTRGPITSCDMRSRSPSTAPLGKSSKASSCARLTLQRQSSSAPRRTQNRNQRPVQPEEICFPK